MKNPINPEYQGLILELALVIVLGIVIVSVCFYEIFLK